MFSHNHAVVQACQPHYCQQEKLISQSGTREWVKVSFLFYSVNILVDVI